MDCVPQFLAMMCRNFKLASLFGLLSVGAMAHSVTLTFLGTGAGHNVKISTNAGTSFQGVFGGINRMREVGTPNFDFLAMCGDPKTVMASGNYSATITDSSAITPHGLKIGHLINTHAPAIFAMSNGAAKNDKALALQLAVWELIVETAPTFDLTAGDFRAKEMDNDPLNSTILTLANGYLSENGSGLAKFYKSAVNGSGAAVSQSMLTPVPEPATLGALAIGTLAFIRKRKSR
jgi:hypothetical protein